MGAGGLVPRARGGGRPRPDRPARPRRRRGAVLAGARQRRRAPRAAADPAHGVLARAQRADDLRPLPGRARLGTRELPRRRRASGSSSRTRSPRATRCREASSRRRPTTRPRCCSGSRRSAPSQRATSCSARPEAGSASAPTRGSPPESRLRRSASSYVRCSSTCRSSSFSSPTASPVRENAHAQLAAALTA